MLTFIGSLLVIATILIVGGLLCAGVAGLIVLSPLLIPVLVALFLLALIDVIVFKLLKKTFKKKKKEKGD